jgi:hypothetical protein
MMSLPMNVYGQVLDHPLCCTKAEARRCWTVKDRMLVTIEPEFDVYCKENYQLEDDINKVRDDDNDGYFSGDDDLPHDEMNEVSDECFEDHLMDGVTPAKSANHSKKKDKKEPTVKNDLDIPMYDRKPPPESIVQMESTKDTLCQDVDDGKLPPPPKLPAFQDRKPPPEGIGDETVSPPTQDDNGLIFGPSCIGRCFIMDHECAHEKVKVQLNEVGQYVVFPSLWWHHGYYDIKDDEKVIFTAQLFATPSSDIGNTKRSNRRNSKLTDEYL